jgi:hypothetical protein
VGGRASEDGEEWRWAATRWGEERRRGEQRAGGIAGRGEEGGQGHQGEEGRRFPWEGVATRRTQGRTRGGPTSGR